MEYKSDILGGGFLNRVVVKDDLQVDMYVLTMEHGEVVARFGNEYCGLAVDGGEEFEISWDSPDYHRLMSSELHSDLLRWAVVEQDRLMQVWESMYGIPLLPHLPGRRGYESHWRHELEFDRWSDRLDDGYKFWTVDVYCVIQLSVIDPGDPY